MQISDWSFKDSIKNKIISKKNYQRDSRKLIIVWRIKDWKIKLIK